MTDKSAVDKPKSDASDVYKPPAEALKSPVTTKRPVLDWRWALRMAGAGLVGTSIAVVAYGPSPGLMMMIVGAPVVWIASKAHEATTDKRYFYLASALWVVCNVGGRLASIGFSSGPRGSVVFWGAIVVAVAFMPLVTMRRLP
jgi:hypothetical protein